MTDLAAHDQPGAELHGLRLHESRVGRVVLLAGRFQGRGRGLHARRQHRFLDKHVRVELHLLLTRGSL